jgi:hypothetical protein
VALKPGIAEKEQLQFSIDSLPLAFKPDDNVLSLSLSFNFIEQDYDS